MSINIPDYNGNQVTVPSSTVNGEQLPHHHNVNFDGSSPSILSLADTTKAPQVVSVDVNGRHGEIDRVGGYIVFLKEGHHKRHEGEMFRYIHKMIFTGEETQYMLLTTGPGPGVVHIEFFNNGGTDKAEFVIYKSPTTTANGTDDTANAYNVEENSSIVPSGLTIYNDPIVTAPGILRDGMFSDKYQPSRSSNEHILKSSTNYLIEIIATKSLEMYMGFEWYNQSPKFEV